MAFVPRGSEVDEACIASAGWSSQSQQEVVVAEAVRPGSSSRNQQQIAAAPTAWLPPG